MSAVIHTLPRDRRSRDRDRDREDDATRRSQTTLPARREPETDELLAELAHAVETDRPRYVGTANGPSPLVSIRPDRRRGTNDLVAVAGRDELAGRRRVVAMMTSALALVLAMFAGLGGAWADSDSDVEVAGTTTLQSGQTLWQLADQITPADQDVRPNLEAIMTVNEFDSAALPAGTLVLLPVVE